MDTDTGREVAWNTVNISNMDEDARERTIREIGNLASLEEQGGCSFVIRFFGSFYKRESKEVVFITEKAPCDLHRYIQRVQRVKLKVIRKW